MEELSNRFLSFVEHPRPCSYLPAETAALEYRLFPQTTPSVLEEQIRRGWRRFGETLFRPACPDCQQCVPVRVDAERFEPSKSQRRNLKKNSAVRVSWHPASVSDEHIALYNDWHADMMQRSGWPDQTIDASRYGESFLSGDYVGAREARYFAEDQLIGVGLVDLLPDGLSSVYFYHAPGWRSQGPGTFSLLQELQLARELGLRFVYLGYWIAACPSMAYKNRFHPSEILHGRPDDDQEPDWRAGAF